ncbi:hypothetical protein EDE05_10658 [Neorhizobium sp. R1-B]|nr:hypothetical protein EDE05_10658 [Neorhizobium sp. R1-B]
MEVACHFAIYRACHIPEKLKPLHDKMRRGKRFFGRLRLSFVQTAIIGGFMIGWLLGKHVQISPKVAPITICGYRKLF